jgi:hypothetical protein
MGSRARRTPRKFGWYTLCIRLLALDLLGNPDATVDVSNPIMTRRAATPSAAR